MPHGGHVRCLGLRPELVVATSAWVCNVCRPPRRPRGRGTVVAVQETPRTVHTGLESGDTSSLHLRPDPGDTGTILSSPPTVPQRSIYPPSRAGVSGSVCQVLSPNLFAFLPDEFVEVTDEGGVRDPSDGARLANCSPAMLVQEAAFVTRPEQTATPVGAGVTNCLVVPEKHMRLQMGGMPVPLSPPVTMAPDDCPDLGGRMFGFSPSFVEVVDRDPRASNERFPRGLVEVVSRFSNDTHPVLSFGMQGVVESSSPTNPVNVPPIVLHVPVFTTPLDLPSPPESLPHNQHPYRDG